MKQKGFTLIELLVVISIIGIVAALALVALSSVRVKARDAKRVADFRQFKNALALYYQNNGTYPHYDATNPTNCSGGWADYYPPGTTCWNDLKVQLSPYIANLPEDPINRGGGAWEYMYRTEKAGQGYRFMFLPELTSTGLGQDCYGSPWYCVGENWQ